MRRRALAAGLLLAPLLLAAAPRAPFWTGTAAGVAIRWDAGDLTFARGRGAPFYSARQRFFAGFQGLSGCDAEERVRLLSVVGPVVSFETDEAGYCQGTTHPFAERHFRTLDLRRGDQPARLTDYFPEAEVLQALLGDRLVKKALADKPRPGTLKAFFDALDGYSAANCLYGFPRTMLEHFAFHHLAGRDVAVRIGLAPSCAIGRGHLTQLGLLLPIPPALSHALALAASQGQGFLMQAAPDQISHFNLSAHS